MATAVSLNRGQAGFWRRQFTGAGTNRQKAFDGLFGAVAPVVALMVFRQLISRSSDWGLLGAIVLWSTGLQITLLSFWHAGGRLVPLRSLLGTLLSVGGLLWLASGAGLLIALYPFVVAPMLLVPLALVPVLAGFVYLRVGVRALTLR